MVLIFQNDKKPQVRRVLPALRRFLKSKGSAEWVIAADKIKEIRNLDAVLSRQDRPPKLAIALGGDGTLLAAAKHVIEIGTPLMGINLGGLGFLAAAEYSEWQRAVSLALEGRLPREERLSLAVEVVQGRRTFRHTAINDCVVRSGRGPRMIELEIYSDRHGYLARLRGDGVIVATPTGSTAYALAAGGPIVEPRIPAFLVLPLAASSLTQRPFVLEASQKLEIRLGSYGGEKSRAAMFIDGQIFRELTSGDKVRIAAHPKPLILLRHPKKTYFHHVREKLAPQSP